MSRKGTLKARSALWGLPRIDDSNSRQTSPATATYNCIAWAMGDTSKWWWPEGRDGCYWPPGAPLEPTLEAFRVAFSLAGFELCASFDPLSDLEIVVLYAKDESPTHAARSLPSGKWTSKLGRGIDIEHVDLEALAGGTYGEPRLAFCRSRALEG